MHAHDQSWFPGHVTQRIVQHGFDFLNAMSRREFGQNFSRDSTEPACGSARPVPDANDPDRAKQQNQIVFDVRENGASLARLFVSLSRFPASNPASKDSFFKSSICSGFIKTGLRSARAMHDRCVVERTIEHEFTRRRGIVGFGLGGVGFSIQVRLPRFPWL